MDIEADGEVMEELVDGEVMEIGEVLMEQVGIEHYQLPNMLRRRMKKKLHTYQLQHKGLQM